MKTLLLVVLILVCNIMSMNSQDLRGKWMEVKEGNTYTIPNVCILEFDGSEVQQYEFDTAISKESYKLVDDYIIVNGKVWGKVSFINDNRLSMEIKGRLNDKDKILSIDFVRLTPTITNSSKNEIEKLSYDFKWNNENTLIKFSKKPKNQNAEDSINLEMIDSTMMVSIYNNGKRRTSIPIFSASKKNLILYGMPSKPYFISAKPVK